MNFSLKQLQLFVAIVKTGSLSKAADAVFMSQPAASMSLKQLEENLGSPLFDRIGKQLKINAFGQQQHILAHNIISASIDFANKDQSNMKHAHESLTINCSLTIGNYILPRYLALFQNEYANIKFKVTIENSDQSIHKVEQLESDLAFIESPIKQNNILEQYCFQQDHLIILARKNHPLTIKKDITVKNLQQYSWALREKGSGTRQFFDALTFGKINLDEQIILNSFEAIKQYILNSDCLTYISESALTNQDQKLFSVLPCKHLKLQRPFTMVWHKHKYHSDTFKQFIKLFE